MMRFYRRIKSLFILSIVLALLISSATIVRPVVAADQTVTNTGDSGPGSLRQAIIDVIPGGTITFDPSLSGGTITLTSTELRIEKNLTIDGSALPDQITISGNNNMTVFIVNVAVTATLDSLIITDGKSKYGSGIDNWGTLTVNNSTIFGNQALYEGGGIRNKGTLIVINSTLSGNTAEYGGGIYNKTGSLTVTNSTFSLNSAFDGGGILNDAILYMINSTLSENSAGCSGGGILNLATLNYANTIIANSILGLDCVNNCGTIGPTNFNNLVETGNCGPSYSTADPLLGPLANNGGPTLTHALLFGSPAIDAGNPAYCPETDQRGVSRPKGAGCDIGAFEYFFAVYLPVVSR